MKANANSARQVNKNLNTYEVSLGQVINKKSTILFSKNTKLKDKEEMMTHLNIATQGLHKIVGVIFQEKPTMEADLNRPVVGGNHGIVGVHGVGNRFSLLRFFARGVDWHGRPTDHRRNIPHMPKGCAIPSC